MLDDKKIIVIGAGVMGAGIAAQIANSGNKVLLLDIVLKDSADKNILAKNGIEKLKNLISSATKKNNILVGNLDDNENDLKDADWIIEVIVEKLDIKRKLYEKLEENCKADCIISSNTSTIPLKDLIFGRSEKFKKSFMITHFFNPPRYMQLVELITSEYNSAKSVEFVSEFLDVNLGKQVVKSNDTPGFIANRIGCYFLQVALHEAIEHKLSIEEVDSLLSLPIGLPKTGVFGLYDLIGIDVMSLIAKSLIGLLPKDDPFNEVSSMPMQVQKMIELNLLGRKTNGGFYRMVKDEAGNKNQETINLTNLEYKPSIKVKSPVMGVKDIFDLNDYCKRVLLKTLCYAASIVPDTSESIYDIDRAMKLGYNWKYGPFEMIDLISIDHFDLAAKKEKIELPPLLKLKKKLYLSSNEYLNVNGEYDKVHYPKGVIYLSQFNNIIYQNESLKFIDLGEGSALLNITSKMATLDHDVFDGIINFFNKLYSNYKSLVIYGGEPNFSVGGNLKYMLECAEGNNFKAVDDYLQLGQQAMLSLKYAKIPVVSALRGMALGGGMEILLHSAYIIAHLDTVSGLVEPGVGLIPSWGGCAQLILKARNLEELQLSFKNIIMGNMSSSSDNLKEMFNLKNISTTMNIDRVLADAKHFSLAFLNDNSLIERNQYSLLKKENIKVSKNDLTKDLNLSLHDALIADYLVDIFTNISASEQELFDLERKCFIELLKTKATRERIAYMLDKGKRLKN